MADLSNFERVIRDWLEAIKEVLQVFEYLAMEIEELENEKEKENE